MQLETNSFWGDNDETAEFVFDSFATFHVSKVCDSSFGQRFEIVSKQDFSIAVIGNVGIDTNVYFNHSEPDFSIESNFTENIDYIGQAGGYSSRIMTQLGFKTAFIGYIGNDSNGRFIREEFEHDGIDTTALMIDPAGTSRSINFMYSNGKRKNFYDGKSHLNLKPDIDLCKKILADSKAAYFHIPDWARSLLPIAKSLKIPIICDIQDVTDPADPYRHDFIKAADYLFFSSVNHVDPAPLMQNFSSINPEQTQICGRGALGCAIHHHNEIRYFPAIELPLPIIDTNGAGDGLASGFIASHILSDYSLEDSILRGQLVARIICTQKASSEGLITKARLEELFRSYNSGTGLFQA